MSKTCTECGTEHSTEWSLSKELAKSNKRMFIAVVALIVSIVLIVAGSLIAIFATTAKYREDNKQLTTDFLNYLNQYDFTDYTVDQGGEWGNTFIGGTNKGDINYGAENTSEDANTQEP